MRRRALLSVGITAATAGCFGFGSGCSRSASLELSAVSDADIADAQSDPPDSLSPPERDALNAARRDESPMLWTVSDPFSSVEYVVDGTYYAVETAVESTIERPGYALSLDTDGAMPGEDVSFGDLSAVDRTALFAGLGYPGPRKRDRYQRGNSISMGGTLAYPTDDAESRSELVPEPSFDVLRIGGRGFRIEIGDPRPVTVDQVRVDVRSVAVTADEFATLVYDRYGVDLDPDEDDLSAEQRDIVETAIGEGYDECAPYSESFGDLQAKLGSIDSPYDYATYDDEWYAVDLFEAVA